MKQIQAFIQSDKLRSVIEAVESSGIGGVTVVSARGRGKGHRPLIDDQRGTGRHTAEYNSLDEIIIIVDDSKVNEITNAITSAASTGSKGDGKIFVLPVEDSIDIGTKTTGVQTL